MSPSFYARLITTIIRAIVSLFKYWRGDSMKYNVNDIVEVVDLEAFYYGALGRIDKVQPGDEYSYYVVFEMIDEYGETSIYEDCEYKANQIKLFEGECL